MGTEQATKEYLVNLQDTVFTDLVFGDYDIIVKIQNHNEEEFKDLIWKIRNYDAITYTDTILVS